ncbi:hypothetical protein [Xylanimonas allomyrinae]|uniref:hypothetical protein n=1 Tax=Xylanimonas allomyrinae TaxID=2509459 RepID=UPI0013A6005F|nr:hypothetical protein [Xylanimonas allomyrinae]
MVHSRGGRRLAWVVGAAALVTVALVVGVAVWFAVGRHDDVVAAVGDGAPGAAATTGATPTWSPLPMTLRERVRAREDAAAELAAAELAAAELADAAGGAGVGSDDAVTGSPRLPMRHRSATPDGRQRAAGWRRLWRGVRTTQTLVHGTGQSSARTPNGLRQTRRP